MTVEPKYVKKWANIEVPEPEDIQRRLRHALRRCP